MLDLASAALNAILCGVSEPIDWERKRLADEQRARYDLGLLKGQRLALLRSSASTCSGDIEPTSDCT